MFKLGFTEMIHTVTLNKSYSPSRYSYEIEDFIRTTNSSCSIVEDSDSKTLLISA